MKIFQIGFNRCGTQSMYNFFSQNGIPSIHNGMGRLAVDIEANRRAGRKLLSGYDQYTFFSDMENVFEGIYAYKYYRDLDTQYPGSKFILNIRNIDGFIQSRKKLIGYLKIYMHVNKMTEQEAIKQWRQHFETHIREVTEYFSGRESDLLIYDIENDSPSQIAEFCKSFGSLDIKHFQRSDFMKLVPAHANDLSDYLYQNHFEIWLLIVKTMFYSRPMIQ